MHLFYLLCFECLICDCIFLNAAVYVLTCINVALEDSIWQLLYYSEALKSNMWKPPATIVVEAKQHRLYFTGIWVLLSPGSKSVIEKCGPVLLVEVKLSLVVIFCFCRHPCPKKYRPKSLSTSHSKDLPASSRPAILISVEAPGSYWPLSVLAFILLCWSNFAGDRLALRALLLQN